MNKHPNDLFITMLIGVVMVGWALISLAVANHVSSPYSDMPSFIKLTCTMWTVSSLALVPLALWMVIIPESAPDFGIFSKAAVKVSLAFGAVTIFPLALRQFLSFFA